MTLRLIAPGTRKNNRFYLAKGRLGGRQIEFSTKTADPGEASRIARAFEAKWSERPRAAAEWSIRSGIQLALPVVDIRRLPNTGECGVYFLFLRGRLQYIGQSYAMQRRLRRHRDDRRFDFDEVRILFCPVDDMDLLEAVHIRQHQPRWNRGLNRPRRKTEGVSP